MIEVPFFWTKRGMKKYLRQYYEVVLKALENRGVKMQDETTAKGWYHSNSIQHKYCYIQVCYFPDSALSTIFSASVMRNKATLWELFDLLKINGGFYLNAHSLLRKNGRGIPSPEELAGRLRQNAARYDLAVEKMMSDSALWQLYKKMARKDDSSKKLRFLKLLHQNGIPTDP